MNQNKSEQAKSTESKRRGNWLKNSIFVRLMIFLGGLEDRVAHSFLISRLAKIRRAFIKRTEIDKKFERPFRLAFSREVEQSVLLHLIDRLCERFLATPLRSYGIFLISFAVYYVAIALSKGYLGGETLLNFSVLITGAVVAAVSLPLLLAQKDTTLSKGILQSSICSFFCFDLLGLEKQEFEKERRPVNGFLGGFLGGIVAAIASAFLPITLILKVAFALIFLRLCYVSPESGMLLSCMLMPFLGDGQTVWLLLSVAFFFLVKLLRGKRNVKSGFYVCAFGLYLIIPLFCGIGTSFDNGFGQMVKFLILSLAFFMPALMFYRTEWTKRAARVLTICAILTSVCAVIVYGSAYIPERYLSLLPFVEMLRGRFADYSDFGAFVVALSPMLALRIFTRAGSRGRPLILLAGIFTVFAVVFSRDPGMWICYLLATALFLLFMERNTLLPMIVAALGGSLVYIFLLPGWITGAIEGFSNGFSVNFSDGSDLILQSAKRFFAGVGFGTRQSPRRQ